jgi:uncharacterized protein YndB with AHSA1/START domain
VELASSARPEWVQIVVQVILNGELALVLLGLAVPWLPFWKWPWQFELGMAAVAIGFTLIGLQMALLVGSFSPPLGFLLCAAILGYLAYWLPESHRRVVVEAEAVIAAPSEAVFALATDPIGSPHLLPGTTVEAETAGAPGLGSRYRGRIKLNRVRFQAVEEIVEYVPPRRFADRTLSGAGYNLTTLKFEPTPHGTRIRYEHVGVLSLANAVLGGGLRRGSSCRRLLGLRQEWFQALRRQLEAPL